MRYGSRFLGAALVAGMALLPAGRLQPAAAEVIRAGPKDFAAKVRKLKPGDTLRLEAGEYAGPVRLSGMHGEPNAPITLEGPAAPLEAVFLGRRGANTLDIADSSHLVIRRLTFDGKNVADDAIKAGDAQRRPVHHLTVEGNTIYNHSRHQTYVGINCQVPAWDWVVRGNVIRGAGTGMYFGSSEGELPFVGGLVEHNEVLYPKGYCIQIKHQNFRPALPGLSTDPAATIIRYNTFAKDDAPSEIDDRPNLLLDGFPDTGYGSQDRYHVYGNTFLGNPRESLFQGTGRISFHDNVMVASRLPAIHITPHSGKKPRSIRIYHNTILAEGEAVRIGGAEDKAEVIVAGNLIVSGMVRDWQRVRMGSNGLLGRWAADLTFASIEPRLGKLDLRLKQPFAVPFPAAQRQVLAEDIDSGLDFLRRPKATWDYCGAYAEPASPEKR